MHLVDTTVFYSPTSGGVKRYLSAKHAWFAAHTSWEHSIVVPGRHEHLQRGGLCTLAGYPVPGTFNYRLPLNPRRWVRVLDELEPGLIEAGDAFHPAWCAWRVARRRGIALAAFYHSNLPQILGRVFGRSCAEPAMRRYVRWLYERFDVVFAPSRVMCAYLRDLGVAHVVHQPLGVDASVFTPERRGPPLRERLGLPKGYAGTALRGALRPGKESPGAAAGVRAPRPALPSACCSAGSVRHVRRRTSPCCPTAVTASSWPAGSPPQTRWCTRAPRKPSGSW